MAHRPIVTLTTDFGLNDHFVGTMKGVILKIVPNAEIVDICHSVQAFDILDGALALAQAYSYFPPRTVHLVVVDPGVGTARRPILAEAADQYFVAPDNGVLSMIYLREKHKVRWVRSEKYFLKPVSRTFHGRDIFAPVGAHMARGAAPAKFGKLITDYMRLNFEKPVRTARRGWTGAILKIDRFGNLITNIPGEMLARLETSSVRVTVGDHEIQRLARTYDDAPRGEPIVLVSSTCLLEIAINQGNAAMLLHVNRGDRVIVETA